MKQYQKNKFYMLIGLPASGKSFTAQQLMSESNREMIWLSSDRIREELYGSESIQGDHAEVFEIMRCRTYEALGAGRDVIYDASNISMKRRRAFLNTLSKYACEKIAVICAAPYAVCLKRNQERERVVPEDVIKRMYMTWNTPIYAEGWDRICLQYAPGTQGSFGNPEAYAAAYMEYDQENPYHLETLGEHLRDAREYLVCNEICTRDSNLAVAAVLHDCGKPFTKGFEDSRGNVSETAHYYQHQYVGAYDALFFDYQGKSEQDILEISALISLHMHPISWGACEENGRMAEKRKLQYGESLYQGILKLHEADTGSRKSD